MIKHNFDAKLSNETRLFDLETLDLSRVVFLKRTKKVYKKYNSTQISVPLGVLDEHDPTVAYPLMFACKGVRMWPPSEKVDDRNNFKGYGTTVMLHEPEEPEDSPGMRRLRSLEALRDAICDSLGAGTNAMTVRKTSVDQLRDRLLRKTFIKDADDQITDEVDPKKPLRLAVKFPCNRKTREVSGVFYERDDRKRRRIQFEEMLELPVKPVTVDAVVYLKEILVCQGSIGYCPQVYVNELYVHREENTSVRVPKQSLLADSLGGLEDAEEEGGAEADGSAEVYEYAPEEY